MPRQWCYEYDMLAAVSEQFSDPPEWMLERVAALSERESGLVDDPFLELPGFSRTTLAKGSHFAAPGADAMTTVFAVAAALQMLRTDENTKDRLDPRYPRRRACGIKTLAFYDEALLRACFLRLVRPREWGQSWRAAMSDMLSRELATPRQKSLLGEVLLAVSRGVLRPGGLDFVALPDSAGDNLRGFSWADWPSTGISAPGWCRIYGIASAVKVAWPSTPERETSNVEPFETEIAR